MIRLQSTAIFVSSLLICLISNSEACGSGSKYNYTLPAEYIAQNSKCETFISKHSITATINHPDITAINAVIDKGVTISNFVSNSGSTIDWRAFILEGWSGGSSVILVAPVVLVIILAFMILSFLPCCIARCCCPSNCCVPKYKFGEFPKKGCCGKSATTVVWFALILGLLACFAAAWFGFAAFFNGFTETSCQSMSALNSAFEFLNDTFSKFLGILDAFDLNTLIVDPATGVLQQINVSSTSLKNTANVTIEQALANCFNISNTSYTSNYTINCDERIPSIDAAIIDTSSLNNVMDKIISSLSEINGTLNSARSAIITAQNSASAPFDIVASSAFGFKFSGGEATSFLPALPAIPVFLPNGLENVTSINNLLFSVTEEQWKPIVVGIAVFLPMLLFVISIVLGTCCMCCGNNSKQIDKMQEDENDAASKKGCCVCCGLCWSRFGCGALYFCNVIFIIVTVVLVFVNTFYSYSCGIITLPPNDLTKMVLNNPTLSGALALDNSTRNIISAIGDSLDSSSDIDLAPLLSTFGLDASSFEINVTQYENSLQNQINISSIVDAIDKGRQSLVTFTDDFETLQTAKSDVEARKNACDLSCASTTSSGQNVWEAARLSYNKSDIFEASMDSINFCADNYNTICGNSAEKACNLTFCEMYTVTVKIGVLAEDAVQGLDLIDVDLLDIRGNVSAIPEIISDIFDTIKQQNVSECLNVDVSPVLNFVKQLTEPICSQVYRGYSIISWSSFSFCVISALLFIVQVIMNIKYGGVGQEGLLRISQELDNQGDEDGGDMHNLANPKVENPLYVNPIPRTERQAWTNEKKVEIQNGLKDIEMTNVSAFQESEIEV